MPLLAATKPYPVYLQFGVAIAYCLSLLSQTSTCSTDLFVFCFVVISPCLRPQLFPKTCTKIIPTVAGGCRRWAPPHINLAYTGGYTASVCLFLSPFLSP